MKARGVLLFVAALAACGGGGGGGGGGSSGPAVSVTNIRASATDQEVFEGDDPITGLQIRADVTGDLASLNGATVYVIVEDPDQLFSTNPSITVTPNGRDSVLSLPGRRPNVRVGDFRGPLRVHVCLDARCDRPFGGSPVSVPYTIKILPGLTLPSTPIVIPLSGDFGAVPPTWDGALQVPVGAPAPVIWMDWNGAAGPMGGPQFADGLFTLTQPAGRLAVGALPAPVGTQFAHLHLQTSASTSRGRNVVLRSDYTVQYTVTGPSDGRILYAPSTIAFSQPAGSSANSAPERVTALVSSGFGIDGWKRWEYLPASAAGNADAGGVRWLGTASVDVRFEGYTYVEKLVARACGPDAFGNVRCLAPGRYEAHLWPQRKVTYAEVAEPLKVTLTVTP